MPWWIFGTAMNITCQFLEKKVMATSHTTLTLLSFLFCFSWLIQCCQDCSSGYETTQLTLFAWLLSVTYCNFVNTIQLLTSCAVLFASPVRTGLEGPGLSVYQKIWYCLGTVGGRYLWSRLQGFSAFRRWGDSEQVLKWCCYPASSFFPLL